MIIPVYILEECKEFCEKLQEVIDEAPQYLSQNSSIDEGEYIYGKLKWILSKKNEPTNAFKTFIGHIISSFLKTKGLYDQDSNALYITNLSTFQTLIQDYHNFFHGQNIEHNPNAIYNYIPYSFTDYYLNYKEKFPRLQLEDLKNFKDWCVKCKNWLFTYADFINQNQKEFKRSAYSYALKYFSITNFQCIRHIEAKLPVDVQFIVFTGENGDGKTSILQALGLGLYNSDDLTDHERGFGSAIEVQYAAHEKSFHNEIYNNANYPTLYTLRHKMQELKAFAAYGASRLKVVENRKLENPLLNLDTNKAKLFNIFESWLRDISVNEPTKFDLIKDLLEELLPNVSEIRKKEPHKTISDFVFVEKGNTVEFEHLSAGHKSIVLMMGDMIMRLSEAQPKITNPKDLEGIVLIDELESHLHPKWQREFPRILSKTFTKVQFIVTTHSAVCLLGMPENTVLFKVKRTETEGTLVERLEVDLKNLLPNQILTSPLFDLESIRSVKNEGIEKLYVEDTFEEIIKNEESQNLLKQLATKFKAPKS